MHRSKCTPGVWLLDTSNNCYHLAQHDNAYSAKGWLWPLVYSAVAQPVKWMNKQETPTTHLIPSLPGCPFYAHTVFLAAGSPQTQLLIINVQMCHANPPGECHETGFDSASRKLQLRWQWPTWAYLCLLIPSQAYVLPVQPFRISDHTFVCRLLCAERQQLPAWGREAHQMPASHKTMPTLQSQITAVSN